MVISIVEFYMIFITTYLSWIIFLEYRIYIFHPFSYSFLESLIEYLQKALILFSGRLKQYENANVVNSDLAKFLYPEIEIV